MTKRIVHGGYTVIPQLGVLDDETDQVTAVQHQPLQVPAGGLAEFESMTWATQLAAIRGEFAKQLEAQTPAGAEPSAPAKKPRAAKKRA